MKKDELRDTIIAAFCAGLLVGIAFIMAVMVFVRNVVDAHAADGAEVTPVYVDIAEGPESAAYVPDCEDLCPYSDKVPLSDELQYLLWTECQAYGIDYLFALATIRLESDFDPKAYNDRNKDGSIDRGICQTNSYWTKQLKELGMITKAEDLYDPVTGIRCGMWELGQCVALFGNTERAYAYYNCGDPSVHHTKASRIVWKYYQEYIELFGRT